MLFRSGADPASQRGGAPRAADLEGADPASQRGGAPRAADLEGADPVSQRGVPQGSGFGRGGSGLSEELLPPEQRVWKGRIRPLGWGGTPEGGGAPAGAQRPKSSGKGRGLFDTEIRRQGRIWGAKSKSRSLRAKAPRRYGGVPYPGGLYPVPPPPSCTPMMFLWKPVRPKTHIILTRLPFWG